MAVYPTVVMNMGWPWSRGWVDIWSCITAGEAFELRECMIRLGVTGFDPSVTEPEETMLCRQTRRGNLVEFFSHIHLRDVVFPASRRRQ